MCVMFLHFDINAYFFIYKRYLIVIVKYYFDCEHQLYLFSVQLVTTIKLLYKFLTLPRNTTGARSYHRFRRRRFDVRVANNANC